MAWFRRNRDEQADEPAGVDTPQPDHTRGRADGSEVIRAERAHAGDWMALPPMAPTVGPPPTTFRVQRLPEIMTTRRPTAVLGQLGHQISGAAPSGRVEGLTTAVDVPHAVSRPVDLPLRAVQRHAEAEGAFAPSIVQRVASAAASTDPGRAETDIPASARPESGGGAVVQRVLAATPAPSTSSSVPSSTVPSSTVPSSTVPSSTVPSSSVPSSSVPSVPSLRSARLPEPAPTRVLREPAMPLATSFTRPLPAAPVVDVGAPSPPGSGADVPAADLIEPDHPVEFTVRSGDAVELPGVAPLAGDVPLQRRADADAQPSTSTDLPLAARPSAPATPLGDLMPPIQPRAIQRKATEAASASPPVAPTAGTGGSASALPPMPRWAAEAMGAAMETAAENSDAVDGPTAATSAGALPLHAPSTSGVQRLSEPEQPPAPAGVDADGRADTAEPVDAVDTAEPVDAAVPVDAAGIAPLVGSAPLVDMTAPSGTGRPESSHDIDLSLHAASAPLHAAATVQREAADTGSDAPPAADDDPAEDIAPLLGDRPLQRQRTSAPLSPSGVAHTPDTPPPALPLVAEAAQGPALDASPLATPQASGDAPLGHVVAAPSRVTTSRTLAASVQRAATSIATPTPPATATHAVSAAPGGTPTPAAASTGSSPAAGLALATPAGIPLRTLATSSTAAPSPLTVQTLHDAGSAPSAAGPSAPAALAAGGSPVTMPLQEPARAASREQPALLGDVALSTGFGYRDADGSVVFTTPAGNGGSYEGATSIGLQREALASGPSHGASAGTPTIVGSAPATEFVVQREASAPTGEGGHDAAEDDKQADELAKKVYDRIRWKLESDMRANERRLGASHWNRKDR